MASYFYCFGVVTPIANNKVPQLHNKSQTFLQEIHKHFLQKVLIHSSFEKTILSLFSPIILRLIDVDTIDGNNSN